MRPDCFVTTEADCLSSGFEYRGHGTICLGDINGNGVNDACEGWDVDDPHKMHYPQLPDEAGWDVRAMWPIQLADDWRCSETGWVKDLHWWGSWKHGITGEVLAFNWFVYADIPANPPDVPFSRPGAQLWQGEINVFGALPIDPPTTEGWYDPVTGEFLLDDHQEFFQYNVYLPEAEWFFQEEGTIYWLSLSAIVANPELTEWGWKSSIDHFNDDAVYGFPGQLEWMEMYEPPNFEQSLDLSFVITGGPPSVTGACCDTASGDCFILDPITCDNNGLLYMGDGVPCTPNPCDCCNTDGRRGDVNGSGSIDVADLTYLVDYLFGGGPPPPCLLEGDVNGSGGIDVSDLTYLVDYLFGGGPPPVDCP